MITALELFERHHLAVFRFLRRSGMSPADAEDVTQDVFLRVVQALPGYQERQQERAWVFRIARNARLDRWRAAARAPAPVALPEHRVVAMAAHVEGIALDEALATLPDGEREAFLLREVGGLGYAEIAEATGATPDAVRSRIHRARLALREALGGCRAAHASGGRGE